MVEPAGSPTPQGRPEEDPLEVAVAASLPSLLLLLAETRDQLDQARHDRADAESRAQQSAAESARLRADIDRMATELTVAQARIAELYQEWLAATAGEEAARARAADLLSSRSWRITAPVRAATGAAKRRGAQPPSPGGPGR